MSQNRPAVCSYIFHIVVTNLKTNIKIEDHKKLQVNAQFNGVDLKITSSRINIRELDNSNGHVLRETPSRLQKTIAKCGMPVSVVYDNRVLGFGNISFPPMFTHQISKDMGELIHAGTCQFEQQTIVAGTLEVLCRLCLQCDEKTMQEQSNCQQNVDKSINPQDIMFVMGENQQCPSPCDPCQDILEPDGGDEALKLDLRRYHGGNIGTPRPAETLPHSLVAGAATCVMKKMARECEQIIDSVFRRTGQPQPLKPPRRTAESLTNPRGGETYSLAETPPTSTSLPCFSHHPTIQNHSKDVCSPKVIPMPLSDKGKTNIKPIRFCPVCLTNMSWLPKFAACPNCGVKPMPMIEERHKQKLTAEQILMEYLGKPPLTVEHYCENPCAKVIRGECAVEKSPGCRCICKNGTICAHCRIRKLCADIFQDDEHQAIRPCPEVKPRSSEDFCVEQSSLERCRPHLARVFSELRDLYNVKEARKTSELRKRCGQDSSGKKKPQKASEEPKYLKKAKSSVENRKKGVQNDPTIRAAHKSCVKQQAGVSRRHGWAWSSSEESRKYGWKPGFVRKSIKKIMKFFLYYLPTSRTLNKCVQIQKAEMKVQLPILNVCKKRGEIFITLRAGDNHHVDMKPIQFKIVKSDFAVALSLIKRKLKARGFRKCTCHKTLMMCVCRNYMEKKQLEFAMQNECKRHGMDNCIDHLVLTDTSDSEMEFDVDMTPPVAVAKPQSLLKPLTLNQATQSSKKHINVPSAYPIKHSSYWRTYDCAAGDRYTGTALGAPGEEVFEDGVFGFRGGGPHGASATPGGIPKSKGIWGASSGGPMHGGGRGGPGSIGGMTFPGDKPKSDVKGGRCQPIPVKNLKRFEKMAAMAAQVKQAAIEKENEKRKLGINMMKYLKKQGVFSKKKPNVGPDGLTDAQRRRRDLRVVSLPPIEFMPRLGKGCGSCNMQCCNQCSIPCCYRPYYYC